MVLLAITLLVNITVPKLGYQFGAVPVYALDMLKLLFLYFAFKTKPLKVKARPARLIYFVVPIAGFVILSELYGTYQFGAPEISVYTLGQVIPAILMCVGVARCVQSEKDLILLFKVFSIGMIFSGVITILVSLAATRGFVVDTLLSNPILASRDSVLTRNQSVETIRGTSLVGVSNMTGALLNMMLPTMVILFRVSSASTVWKAVAIAAVTIGILATMTTYSRSAYIGFALLAAAIVVMGSFRGKWLILFSASAIMTSVVWVGIDSDYFFFDRIERRMNAALYDPYADAGESERIDSYLKAGDTIVKNPSLLVMGEGSNPQKRTTLLEDRPDHSVFGRALFSYGLLASLAYCALFIAAVATAIKTVRLARDRRSPTYDISRVLAASIVATLPWFMFTHAIVSNPRAASFYFAFVGLIYAVNRMALAEAAWRRSMGPRPAPAARPLPDAVPGAVPGVSVASYLARSGK